VIIEKDELVTLHCDDVRYLELCCSDAMPTSVHGRSMLQTLDVRGNAQFSSTQRSCRGALYAETCHIYSTHSATTTV